MEPPSNLTAVWALGLRSTTPTLPRAVSPPKSTGRQDGTTSSPTRARQSEAPRQFVKSATRLSSSASTDNIPYDSSPRHPPKLLKGRSSSNKGSKSTDNLEAGWPAQPTDSYQLGQHKARRGNTPSRGDQTHMPSRVQRGRLVDEDPESPERLLHSPERAVLNQLASATDAMKSVLANIANSAPRQLPPDPELNGSRIDCRLNERLALLETRQEELCNFLSTVCDEMANTTTSLCKAQIDALYVDLKSEVHEAINREIQPCVQSLHTDLQKELHDMMDKDVMSAMDQKVGRLVQHTDHKFAGLIEEVREMVGATSRQPGQNKVQLTPTSGTVEFLPTPTSSARTIPTPQVAIREKNYTSRAPEPEKYNELWKDFHNELARPASEPQLGQENDNALGPAEIDRYARLQEMCQIAGMPLVEDVAMLPKGETIWAPSATTSACVPVPSNRCRNASHVMD